MKAAESEDLDRLVEEHERVERLLRDRSVRASARACWGHIYAAMKDPTYEDLVEIVGALERARMRGAAGTISLVAGTLSGRNVTVVPAMG
jgi:hypothetical protein